MSIELLTVADVARRLSVHEKTVRRLVAQGELTTVRIGTAVRLHPDDVDAFIDERRAVPRGRSRRARASRPTAQPLLFVDRLRFLDSERASG